MTRKPNDWNEHKMHLMETLERMEEKMDQIGVDQQALRTEVAVLKTKAGFYGAIMGFFSSIVIKSMGGG